MKAIVGKIYVTQERQEVIFGQDGLYHEVGRTWAPEEVSFLEEYRMRELTVGQVFLYNDHRIVFLGFSPTGPARLTVMGWDITWSIIESWTLLPGEDPSVHVVGRVAINEMTRAINQLITSP